MRQPTKSASTGTIRDIPRRTPESICEALEDRDLPYKISRFQNENIRSLNRLEIQPPVLYDAVTRLLSNLKMGESLFDTVPEHSLENTALIVGLYPRIHLEPVCQAVSEVFTKRWQENDQECSLVGGSKGWNALAIRLCDSSYDLILNFRRGGSDLSTVKFNDYLKHPPEALVTQLQACNAALVSMSEAVRFSSEITDTINRRVSESSDLLENAGKFSFPDTFSHRGLAGTAELRKRKPR